MNKRTLSLAMSIASFGVVAMSSAQQIVVAGPVDFGGPIGSSLNTVLTGQSPVTSAFIMGEGITVASGDLTEVNTGTYATEATIRMENSAFPGIFYATDLTDATTYTGTFSVPAGTVRPWTTDGGNSNTIPVASTWNLEFYETFDDGGVGVDETGSNINFTINPPPVFNVDSGVLAGPYNSAGAPGDAGNGVADLGAVAASFIFPNVIRFSGTGAEVITAGALSEGRLRIRSSAYPGISAEFQMTASATATQTINNASCLSPGTALADGGGNLLRGLTIPAASTMTGEFFELFDNGAGADSSWSNVRVKIQTGSAVGTAPAPTATDLGTLTDATLTTTLVATTAPFAGQVEWYKFTLGNAVSLAGGRFLDIWTSQPGTTGFSSDTVLCLYDANGRYLAYNDDGGGTPTFMSAMSFGGGSDTPTTWTQTAGDLPFNGRSGDGLPAGEYYLAVCQYLSSGRGDGFAITASATANNGTNVNFRTNLPSSNQTLTGNLILGDTAFSGASTRNIAWSVMQGTTNLGSGTIVAGAPSTAMNLVVASATGSAELILDGSSFLKRKVNLTLTNSNQAIGNATMQNGDVDNSGEVDAADIDQVIAAFGNMGDNVEDVDVSDEVDAADIDIVIANFGGMDD